MVWLGLCRCRSLRQPSLIAFALVGLKLFLFGCDLSGGQSILSTPGSPSAQAEQQAIERLLVLYREAVLAEDLDRLQALLRQSWRWYSRHRSVPHPQRRTGHYNCSPGARFGRRWPVWRLPHDGWNDRCSL
jgi:hypothetical protein